MYTLKNPELAQASALDIRTIKDMWNAAIGLQAQGVFDTDAMYQIFQAMNPKLTMQNIATVCSGVYADTYWNTNLLDPSLLAKSLVQALGVNQAQANTYAGNAVQQWSGILSRKNISDVGQIPVVGNYTGSLDIVCNQNTPLEPAQLIQNWNDEYWLQPTVGKNYVYARVQNTSFNGPIANAQVQMFYSTGGFNQPPSSWVQCFTVANNKKVGTVQNQVGQVGALNWGDRGCSEAFFFTPLSNDHVCVISATTSEFFSTNNPTQIQPGNWNSVTWITHNGAAAWHNVDPQLAAEDSLAFYNQDGSDEVFRFSLNCRGVPVGSTIRLRSDEPGLQFDTGAVAVVHPAQTLQQTVTVPAYHQGKLLVTLMDPKGKMLPATAAAEVAMEWLLPHGHAQYAEAARLGRAFNQFQAQQPLALNMGTFTLLGSGR